MLRKVKTNNGWVQGIPAADPRITAFKGIPYAKPPVGELRWKEPQPADDWEGVLLADKFAPISMQETPGLNPDNIYTKEWHVDPDVPMSEDCLYLNIWTPAKTGNEKLPVMFWIFGGGLQCGYPSEMEFDGERISRRDVILVSVNYRVNIFGFFTHPELTREDPEAFHANFGLLDQIAGMKWVKENISYFGGDPGNVTIFGQSAGAGSVTMHLTSPLADGLFHKAIIQSGGGLLPPSINNLSLTEAEKKGELFLSKNGLSSLSEARSLDAKELLAIGLKDGPWSSVTDGKYLLETPTETFVKNEHKKIPLIIGNTGNEFIVRPSCNNLTELTGYLEDNFGDAKDSLLEIAMTEGDDLAKMIDNLSYNRFEIGNTVMCEINSEAGGAPIYNYYFDPEIPGDDAGSFHSSELWFTFETLAKCWRPFVGKHYDLARKICNYWTNFAKYGNPNGIDANGTAMADWKPYNADGGYRMRFADDCILETSINPGLSKLLTEFYCQAVKDISKLRSLNLPMRNS